MDNIPISFYEYLRSLGYTDSDARKLIARHNSFKEKGADLIPIKKYAEYLRSFKA